MILDPMLIGNREFLPPGSLNPRQASQSSQKPQEEQNFNYLIVAGLASFRALISDLVSGRRTLCRNFFQATGQRAARFNPNSEFATSLPFFGRCARGTAKHLREMALVGETCLERDKRDWFPTT